MPEPGLRVKLVTDRLRGEYARVWVDDVEISQHITTIEIKAEVGKPNEVHLVGFAREIEAEIQTSLLTTTAEILKVSE